MNVLKVLLFTCSSLVLFTSESVGQHFCSFGSTYPTLRESLENSEVLVQGKVLTTYPANPQARFPGMTVVAIQKVEKGNLEVLVEEQLVAIPYHLDISTKKTIRLPGNFNHQGELIWGIDSCHKLCLETFQYLVETPEKFDSDLDRASYYFQYIEHPVKEIALDAALEFQEVPIEALIALSKIYGRAVLLKRLMVTRHIENNEVRSLYAFMLGKCGNDSDADYLKTEIQNRLDNFHPDLQGLITGYLLISGPEGLGWIENEILKNEVHEFDRVYSAYVSIRAMKKYGNNRIKPERLCQSMRILLGRPELADLVIVDLARWEDWGVMDKLMENYDNEGYQESDTKRAIVHYLLIAEKDGILVVEGELPKHVKKATANLKKLRQEDPKTVMSAERYFFD